MDGSILCLVERINRNRMYEKFDAVSYCCSGTHQDPCVNLFSFYYIYVNLFSVPVRCYGTTKSFVLKPHGSHDKITILLN